MPRLPSPDDISRPDFSPNTQVVREDLRQGIAATGRLGQTIVQDTAMVAKQMDDIAELHAKDALIALKRQQNQLIVGDEGYARLLNGAATEPGVVQKFRERFNTEAGGLAVKLSPQARQKFELAARDKAAEFEAGLLTHVVRQDISHRGEVFKAQVDVAAETAGLNFNNPEALAREFNNIDISVAQFIEDNGIKDASVRERMLQDARGGAHSQVVNAFLDAGQAQVAEEYLKGNRLEMSAATASKLTNLLKPEIANEIGRQVSEELFALHSAGVSESEIFQKKLELTKGRSLDVVRMTDALYGDRVKALEQDRVRASGDILLGAWSGGVGTGFSDPALRDIDRSDPVLGARLRGQIQAIQRRNAAPGGGEAKATPMDMVTYFDIAQGVKSGQISRDDLMQAADKIPRKEFASLVKMQEKADTDAGKFTIPAVRVNAGIPKSASDTMRKNAYKGFVEAKLQEWKEDNPGRLPTFEEQRGIISSATEGYVSVGLIYNSSVEAYRAKEGKAYPKSFDAMLQGRSEDDKLRAYADVLRARGAQKPGERRYSDAEMIDAWVKNESLRAR